MKYLTCWGAQKIRHPKTKSSKYVNHHFAVEGLSGLIAIENFRITINKQTRTQPDFQLCNPTRSQPPPRFSEVLRGQKGLQERSLGALMAWISDLFVHWYRLRPYPLKMDPRSMSRRIQVYSLGKACVGCNHAYEHSIYMSHIYV